MAVHEMETGIDNNGNGTEPHVRTHRELWGIVKRNERGFWTRIGTGFENRDGSWTLLFDYMPMHDETRIQMREPKERDTGPV